MCQRLGGNPTAPGPDWWEPPGRRLLPRWGGDQGRLPLDTHLIKKPHKAPSGLERRRCLVPSDVGLTLARRRHQHRFWHLRLRRGHRRGRLAEARRCMVNHQIIHRWCRVLRRPSRNHHSGSCLRRHDLHRRRRRQVRRAWSNRRRRGDNLMFDGELH